MIPLLLIETSAEFCPKKVNAIWTEIVEKGFKPDIILELGLERKLEVCQQEEKWDTAEIMEL